MNDKSNKYISDNRIKVNIKLPNDIIEIANEFKKHGKEIYVVGGAIRDYFQNKFPHDFDLVTNALPEESKQILNNFNVSDEQGKSFGVLRIYTKNEPEGYELASFRKDISFGRDTKGNDQKVEIGKSITIQDDSERRDLTINALYYDINNKEIIDLVGGVDDINNKIIRTVGNPIDRFNEDRLRILRIFRFSARTNSNIDRETEKALKIDNRLFGISNKEDVSKERIQEEFNKTIEHAKNDLSIMQRYVDLLSKFEMWKQMFGVNLKYNKNINVDVLNKSIIFYDLLKNNIFNNNLKKELIFKLKFDSKTTNELLFINSFISISIENIYNLTLLKNRFHITNDFIIELKNHYKLNSKLVSSFIKYSDAGFVVNGEDLIKLGFKGNDISVEKQRLETERFVNVFLK